jgi:hypothetical protein
VLDTDTQGSIYNEKTAHPSRCLQPPPWSTVPALRDPPNPWLWPGEPASLPPFPCPCNDFLCPVPLSVFVLMIITQKEICNAQVLPIQVNERSLSPSLGLVCSSTQYRRIRTQPVCLSELHGAKTSPVLHVFQFQLLKPGGYVRRLFSSLGRNGKLTSRFYCESKCRSPPPSPG